MKSNQRIKTLLDWTPFSIAPVRHTQKKWHHGYDRHASHQTYRNIGYHYPRPTISITREHISKHKAMVICRSEHMNKNPCLANRSYPYSSFRRLKQTDDDRELMQLVNDPISPKTRKLQRTTPSEEHKIELNHEVYSPHLRWDGWQGW